MNKPIKRMILAISALCVAMAGQVQAAVKDAAWLQGTKLVSGTNDLQGGDPVAISWDSVSSIDGGVYEHGFANPGVLTVLKDGDYLVAFTGPIDQRNGTPQRATQKFELYVNGEIVPGALGQSTYVRNASGHSESSGHFTALATGLSAGDQIEVKSSRVAQNGGSTFLETASLYVEHIGADRTAFNGLATETVGGPDFNRDLLEADRDVAWAAGGRNDGFSVSNGAIELPGAGNYLVFVNIPLNSTVQRAAPSLTVRLNGEEVENGWAEQAYIRSTGGHNEASLHWSGVINGSGSLTVDTQWRAQTGEVVIDTDKEASIYIEKLGNSGVLDTASYDILLDYNSAEGALITWDSPDESLDSSTYAHAALSPEIRVTKAGSYLLVYNDQLEGGNARANPVVTVQVNGNEVPGLTTKSHYIRQTGGHIGASGTIVGLLDGLKADDIISIHTVREDGGAGGLVSGPAVGFSAGSSLSLIKKEAFVPDPSSGLPPRINKFQGDLFGFVVEITDLGGAVDTASVAVTLNGESVEASADKDGIVTSITYAYSTLPDPGATVNIGLTYSDEGGTSYSQNLSYENTAVFTRVSAGSAVTGVNTGTSGFNAKITQLTEFEGNNGAHGNSVAGANIQITGINPLTGEPFVNEATQETAEVEVINFEQDGLAQGNFNFNNNPEFRPIIDDQFIPGIPGTSGTTEGIAAEFTTFLELDAGLHSFGVNSDDGFAVTIGRSSNDLFGQELGSFNGGRGANDSIFDFVIDEPGFYPTRVVWYEGTGGASVEFFSVVDGEKILVNDRDNPKATKAYRTGPSLPGVTKYEAPDGSIGQTVEIEISDAAVGVVEGSVGLVIDGVDVTESATVSKSGGITSVSYDNGELFAGGVHTVTLSYDEASSPVTTRVASQTFRVPVGRPDILDDFPDVHIPLGFLDGSSVIASVGVADGGVELKSAANNVTVVPSIVPAATDGALLFDASQSSSVNIPNGPNLNNVPGNPGVENRTYELWFQARNLPEPGAENRQVIYEEGGTTRGTAIYLDGVSDTEADLYFIMANLAETVWGGSTGPFTIDGSSVISTRINAGETYHVAYVLKDGSDDLTGSLTAYVNGQEVGRKSGVGRFFNHTDAIGLGRPMADTLFHDGVVPGANGSGLYLFDGIIDEFTVFDNRALDSSLILAHYEDGLIPAATTGGGEPATLGISISGSTVTITWDGDGTLESSSSVNGGYSAVAGASSPHEVDASSGLQFYRVTQ